MGGVMKKSKATKTLEKAALRHGVPVKEIRRGIAEAIDIAYAKRNESNAGFWGGGRKSRPSSSFSKQRIKKS
jgi:hypothetical protein